MNTGKIKIWELSLLLALCFSLCWGTHLQSRQQALSERIIRLHVIAESDEEQAQALKLQVRDAVLAVLLPLTESARSPEQARDAIAGALPLLEQTAESAARGRPVTVLFGRESYATRVGEGYTLPAGSYESLRVVIGSGEGQNWWGILFPQLTESATGDYTDAMKLLGEKEFALITEENAALDIRFRLLEWLREIGARMA